MLVHTVYFWLKDDMTEEEVAAFQQGLESLEGIESADAVYVGTPSDTPQRPVVDNSFSFALTVLLKDMPAHDAYQAHKLHQSFLAKFASNWNKVTIYDAD